VAFHGPMPAADLARGLDDDERQSLLAALAGRPLSPLTVARGDGEAREGILLGGCLSLLASTLGTAFAPDLAGSILFLEEVDEPLYRFDRLLTHLRLSGSLAGISGLVSGHLSRVGGAADDERHGSRECRDLLRGLSRSVGATFAWGLEAGHDRPNLTLPLGTWARLEPERGVLTLDPLSGEETS